MKMLIQTIAQDVTKDTVSNLNQRFEEINTTIWLLRIEIAT